MSEINLSYVITTRNKLPYLKEVLKRLLANVQSDEEVIVVDGSSIDGTVEYLTDLYKKGEIHQFVSEPDKGEAHGYNKGFLMARGTLVKDITDDDAYYYPAIQQCKKFMLEHEEVDVMSGNSAEVNLEDLRDLSCFKLLVDSEQNYKKWLENGSVISLIGLPFMMRKKSLALTGLYSTESIWPDFEFSLRITSLNVNIAWNESLIAVRIENSQSNVRNLLRGQMRYLEDRKRLMFFYDSQYRKKYYQEILRSLLRPIKKFVFSFFENEQTNQYISSTNKNEAAIAKAFILCDEFMEKYNKNNTRILCRRLSEK